jgi:hypothetical protein
MNILNAFQNWLNKSASIYSITDTISQVDGSKSSVSTLKATINVAFYEGSSADQFIAAKFRANIDGVIIVDPRHLGSTTIVDQDEITISTRTFKVTHVNNELLWDQILVIGVKEAN